MNNGRQVRHVLGQRQSGHVPSSPIPERSAMLRRQQAAKYQRALDEAAGDMWDPDERAMAQRRGGPMANGRGNRNYTDDYESYDYDNEEYEEEAPPRIQQRVNPRGRRPRQRVDTNYRAKRPRRKKMHWLFYLGVICVCCVGFFQLIQLAGGGIASLEEDHTYGYPRTEQKDFVVGHHDSATNPSHFIALNLHGKSIVIEYPGGDPSHAKTYLGPLLLQQNADLVPLDMSLVDINGDHRLDIKVYEQGITWYLVNTGTTFTVVQ